MTTTRLPAEEHFSKELVYEIGLLTMTAASCEQGLALHMGRLIAHPGKLDPATLVALAGTENSVLIQQIQILSRLRLAPEVTTEIIDLCDKIRECFQRRNELAHSMHAPGKKLDEVILRTIKLKASGAMVKEKPYTTEQIRGFTSTLVARAKLLHELLRKAGVAPLLPSK